MREQLTFIDFLKKSKSGLLQTPVVCFTSSADYPLLFFSRAMRHLKKNNLTQIQAVNCQSASRQQIIGQLETSFLGATTLYWLRDVSALSAREQSFWYEYCAQYTGSNMIWFFVHNDKSKKSYSATVAMPTAIDKSLFIELSSFFDISLSVRHKQFITQLFKHQANMLLDTACLLLEYMQLVGADSKTFFTSTLHNLVPSEQSLFALSTSFLAKNSSSFYPQWQQVGHQYSEQFWCSFFSDLLWRGAQYIRFANEQNMIAARKIGYRLPFSFLKSDWRKLSPQELTAAHSFIYDADFKFKNSCGYAAFDLFFSSFFLNSFGKQ